ncbi:hypothetical protein LMH73_009295 [Vibrio splendidus]|nr:hypothetical protein [Vibrio splendidus]MCC4881852.1 hypothetical protein [Vibrio splendidus]
MTAITVSKRISDAQIYSVADVASNVLCSIGCLTAIHAVMNLNSDLTLMALLFVNSLALKAVTSISLEETKTRTGFFKAMLFGSAVVLVANVFALNL